MASSVSIPEYYADKNIFITGATGFIGKVLIEKLLRSCPEVKGIYCLVRPKRDKSGQERLSRMLSQTLYDKVRTEQPDFASKLHAIHGDICEENLGISAEDTAFLEKNINVVFHSAATINFNEPLKCSELRIAVEVNILGVRKMIKLARGFTNLEAFVHVSSAYANCDRSYIEETVYPPAVEPQKLIDAMDWMTDDMVDIATPHIIRGKPNTYTYTKQLGETLLVQEGSDLPLAIVRPSIVTAAWREPFPGWIDNLNGPSGLYIAVGKGVLRVMKTDPHSVADIIPVDLPVNMIIAVGWYTAIKKPAVNGQIYQITSGCLNPFTWGEMQQQLLDFFKKIPLEDSFRRPNVRITTNDMLYDYWLFVSHVIPAHLVDMGYRVVGRKPRMVALYTKLHKAMSSLNYFTLRSWEWTHNNMDMLRNQLSPQDQKTFYFDPRMLHWPTYMENYAMGTKKFILKEEMSGLPAARAHIRRLRNIRYMFNTVLLVTLWRLLVARSSLARNSWYFVMGLVFKFVQFFRITSTMRS